MTTEDDFQRMLDLNIEDHTTRLILADFLQERDDPRWEGYRALGLLVRRPTFYRLDGVERRRYVWLGEYNEYLSSLPMSWYAALPRQFQECKRETEQSRRQAEDEAALAFSKLSDGERGEILRGVLGTVN